MGSDWRWKAKDRAVSERLTLKYEPGNWGDLLKGAWAVTVAAHWLRRRGAATPAVSASRSPAPFRHLDPFAGAPSYPLVEGSAVRLDAARGLALFDLQQSWRKRGLWASTAILVRDACFEAGAAPDLRVYDRSRVHQAAWRAIPEARLLEGPSARAASREALRDGFRPDLTLIDPYDLFDRWGEWVPLLERAGTAAPALAYLYNKSPRGRGYASQYERFRRRLAAGAAKGNGFLLGRLPSDAILPRAWHEVVLWAPPDFLAAVRDPLAAQTRTLARALGGEETNGA